MQTPAWQRLLDRAVDVRPEERRAVLASFVYFFCALGGWFLIRPIRDAEAAASGARSLKWLFAGTLTMTILLNPIFSSLVVRFPARRFIPYSYRFIALNLVAFFLLIKFAAGPEGSTSAIWIGRAFFVWTTVFVLFITSLFWCFMTDVYTIEQGKRLFGFVGLGGTLGSLMASFTVGQLADNIDVTYFLLISAVTLEVAVQTVRRFPVLLDAGRVERAATSNSAVIGGSVWASFTRLVESPYLLGIAGFVTLFVIGSTFLYSAQTELLGTEFPDRAARTKVLANIDFFVQASTILVQAFLTGRLIKWLGITRALVSLSLISMVGFGVLALVPTFAVLAAFTVVRKAGEYALNRPARETLFTVVSREDKYKAKNFIETVIYRGGDQLAIGIVDSLRALGLVLAQLSVAAVGFSAIWFGLALWLGRRQRELVRGQQSDRPPSSPDDPDVAMSARY
jgi:AAA family ATP:ADP antiporter